MIYFVSSDFLERLCNYLYDAFRPLIIHINHMETLSELCTILKVSSVILNPLLHQEAVQCVAIVFLDSGGDVGGPRLQQPAAVDFI